MASTDVTQRTMYERIDLTGPPTAGAEVKKAWRIVALNAVLAVIAAVLIYALVDGDRRLGAPDRDRRNGPHCGRHDARRRPKPQGLKRRRRPDRSGRLPTDVGSDPLTRQDPASCRYQGI